MGMWTVETDCDTIANIETHYPVLFTPERTCKMYRDKWGDWHCKSCESGADKISGSDGELTSWCDSWPPNFCPYCGAKVIN